MKPTKILLPSLALISTFLAACGSSPTPPTPPTPTGTYTISWKNYDGNILKDEKYNYGEMPSYKGALPTKPSTEQYIYTFSTWSPAIEKVTCDKVYTAIYTTNIREYDIKWYNEDTLIKTDSVPYGETPSYVGPTPTKDSTPQYDYTFTGWSPTIVPVSGEASYYAQYNSIAKKYTVTFDSNGGSLVGNKTVEYGKKIDAPTNPTKPSSEFNNVFGGWYLDNTTFTQKFDFTTTPITSSLTLYAKWISTSKILNDFDATIIESNLTVVLNKYYERATTEIIIPSTVLIKNKCFSIISLSASVFSSCSKLTSVVIPSSVTYIGGNAFQYCSAVTIYCEAASMPGGWVSDWNPDNRPVVWNCIDHLTKDGINYGVTKNNELVVASLADKSLTSINIPSEIDGRRVTSIGERTFYNCSSLKSINIPSSVTSIGKYAFDGCSKLTSITIPTSVTSIGAYVFNDCSSLKTITIPSSVTSIGERAFYNCSCLTIYCEAASTPSGWDYWWNNSNRPVVWNCIDHLTKDGINYGVTKNNELVVASLADKTLTSISIPSEIDGKKVVSIVERAFYKCSSLTSISIISGVTSIGVRAFDGCSKLTSITIPTSVTSIGAYVFNDCSSLNTIVIPNSITSIGQYTFSGSSLTSITIPSSVTSIGKYAFEFCHYLTSITIPSSVTSIGERAFYDCSSLKSITIPTSITSISAGAFHGCRSLTSINIPDSVTSISASAFYGCSSLKSIAIPNSVTSIGSQAFYGCSSLTSIVIPSSVTSIGYGAFSGCSSLTSITIPSCVTKIGERAFSSCYRLTSITIPNSVTSIGQGAVYGCSSLTSITLPFIGDASKGSHRFLGYIFGASSYSYSGDYIPSSLKEVIINDGCTSIAEHAFYACKLTSITIPNSVTSIGDWAIDTSYSSLTIYCEAVAKPSGWSPLWSSVDHPVVWNCIDHFTKDGINYGVTKNNELVVASLADQTLTSISIPSEIDGKKVVSITNSAFRGCSSLTSVVIPNSVTSIGSSAFSGCKSLTSITIPNSVTSIGSKAFYGCSSLESITIPNSVTSIGEYAFYNCSSMYNIYCEAISKPGGWHADWLGNCKATVHWGC